MITKKQVENAQISWGNGVVKIGSLKNDFQEFLLVSFSQKENCKYAVYFCIAPRGREWLRL